MPPNVKGGKKYKKTKHGTGEELKFIEPEDDQMFARVTKMLGGNNLQAYCNDNAVRVCNIRGSMRNRVWINAGDIILVSLREDAGVGSKADVVLKYDHQFLGRLKKREDINQRLFQSMENSDGVKLQEMGQSAPVRPEDDDIFEHEDIGDGKEEEVDIDNI